MQVSYQRICKDKQNISEGRKILPIQWKLTLPVPSISEKGIEIKIKLNLYFHTSLWCLKGFMKALKAFIEPFEAPQWNVKIKI